MPRSRYKVPQPPTTPCVQNLLHSYFVSFVLFSPTILTWRTHPNDPDLVSQSTPKPACNAGHASAVSEVQPVDSEYSLCLRCGNIYCVEVS
jgi:hypothetical protein